MDRGFRRRDAAGARAILWVATHRNRRYDALMVGPWPHRPGTLRPLLTILKGSRPAKLFQRPASIPDLGHVTDFVALKIH